MGTVEGKAGNKSERGGGGEEWWMCEKRWKGVPR